MSGHKALLLGCAQAYKQYIGAADIMDGIQRLLIFLKVAIPGPRDDQARILLFEVFGSFLRNAWFGAQ